MITINNEEVMGWEHAVRGMRNPMNSWDRSDSTFDEEGIAWIGEKDHERMTNLAKAGSVHAKYRRMIMVYVDVTAPLYFWKEFDTYKVGTVANSCSTMHKIADKEFTLDDFSCEHLITDEKLSDDERYMYAPPIMALETVISHMNHYREQYLKTKNKNDWWQMIQLLPSSYNQKRTVMLNYEVLANIYEYRRNHKLDEWRDFCKWIETLPYSEIITCGVKGIDIFE